MNSRMLLIVRHAHRDKSRGRALDNGISPKGRKQRDAMTRALKRWLASSDAPASVQVLSSPKLRCVETVEPLAKHLGVSVQSDLLLDEGPSCERRAAQLIRDWRSDDYELTVWCSHGDWIPAALERLCGSPIELDKSGVAIFEAKTPGGRPELRWLVQSWTSGLIGPKASS